MGCDSDLDKYRRQCESLGLDFDQVQLHQQRLLRALKTNAKQTFDVVDTCRLENGGVLPQGWPFTLSPGARQAGDELKGFVAFIPAAGAGSRYFQPLSALSAALDAQSKEQLEKAAEDLLRKNALDWPLPKRVHDLISSGGKNLSPQTLREAQEAVNLPKALLPCVKEGTTFLELKCREHNSFGISKGWLVGQVFIAPHRLGALFSKEAGVAASKNLKTTCLEQGPALSTLRFLEDGTPAPGDDEGLSMVPAGHGSLISLFPSVRSQFPKAHSVLVRNIDNVQGCSKQADDATIDFLMAHAVVRSKMLKIREALRVRDVKKAAEAAHFLLRWSPCDNRLFPESMSYASSVTDPDIKTLWEVQCRLFHSFPSQHLRSLYGQVDEVTLLGHLYSRPLNSLGQVPNTGNDMGGTPVFVKTANGPQKVCLEIPHASEQDKEKFFANPAKATHFNPVFVAAEISQHGAAQRFGEDNPFWLLAAKTYRGKKVYYHETLLSEVLGNSMGCNTLFIELPRLCFNPHKSLEDAKDHRLADWGCDPSRS